MPNRRSEATAGRSRLVYRIHTGTDGFHPRRLGERLAEDDVLALPWPRCEASVARGDEIVVLVDASSETCEGVSATGAVESIDARAAQVHVRVGRLGIERALDERAISRAVAELPPSAYRHVFMLADELALVQIFALDPPPSRGRDRTCDLPTIVETALAWPPRLSRAFRSYAPAFWVLPAGSPLYRMGRQVRAEVEAASGLCLRFKFGETGRARALAIAIYEALSARGLARFDCVTPIPLSPEKAASGRPHRARDLGLAVAELLETEFVELLSLRTEISKGARRAVAGMSAREFEAEYAAALTVDDVVRGLDRVLVVDDICHEGSTLSAALAAIRSANDRVVAVAAAAGQMATPVTVRDPGSLLRKA